MGSSLEEELYSKITRELRCSVCQNQSIADSQAMVAVDLRRTIYEKIKAGKTEQEIIQFVTHRYGDFVLYQPPIKWGTSVLWLGPLLLLILGFYAITKLIQSSPK